MAQSLLKPALKVLAAIALLWGAPAWSQDDGEDDRQDDSQDTAAAAEASGQGAGDVADDAAAEPPADAAGAEDDAAGPAVGLDEIPELDEQTYEEDDDDFIPSEEIPVDQSIPFPTDI